MIVYEVWVPAGPQVGRDYGLYIDKGKAEGVATLLINAGKQVEVRERRVV
jgi:hypothetical protein